MTERALPGFAVPPARTAGPRRSAELTLWLIVALAILAAVAASTRGVQPAAVLAVFVVPLVLVAGQRVLLAWQTLLGLILA